MSPLVQFELLYCLLSSLSRSPFGALRAPALLSPSIHLLSSAPHLDTMVSVLPSRWALLHFLIHCYQFQFFSFTQKTVEIFLRPLVILFSFSALDNRFEFW